MLNLSLIKKQIVMKIKSINKGYISVVLLLFLFGCIGETKSAVSSKTNLFNGLFNVTYGNNDKEYIWIFTEDTFYTLYSNSESSVGYESPSNYYVKGNKFFSCGNDITTGKTKTLEKCIKNESGREYNIISIDTVLSLDKKSKQIQVQLQIGESNGIKLKMTKHL